MSEHRAAAHISGFYVVLAAIVTGLMGGVVGWYLRPTMTPQPQYIEPAPSLESGSLPQAPMSPDEEDRLPASNTESPTTIDFGALLSHNDPKRDDAEPSEITMQAYYRLLEDEGVPQLDVAKQYLGKRVNWTGYFYSLDMQRNSTAQRYRILLVHDSQRFHDYLYFYLPADSEPEVAKMRNGSKVTVTGVLSGRTTLSDTKIESVENPTQ